MLDGQVRASADGRGGIAEEEVKDGRCWSSPLEGSGHVGQEARGPAFREPVEVGRSPEEQGGRLPTFRPRGAGVWERTQPQFGQHTGQLP